MTDLHGIPNCDTVRRARRWLDARDIGYRFHDVRAAGLDADRLRHWLETLGWQALVNRRSTSWRQLDTREREGLSAATAARLLRAHPTLLRRPVLEHRGTIEVGFSPESYQRIFGSA